MEGDTPETGSKEATQAADAPQYAPDKLGNNAQKGKATKADVNLDLVLDVPVDISLRVGTADISIRDLVTLVEGSVIALDRDSDQPVDVLVNGTLIARGEIVIVDDRYGVRLTDVVSPAERIEKLN